MDPFFLLPVAMFGGFVWLMRRLMKRQFMALGSRPDKALTPNQEATEGAIQSKRKPGKSPSQYLCVAAPVVPVELLMTCQPRSTVVDGMMSFFGIKTFPLGDADFDAKYVILCNDEDIARFWFDDKLKATLLTQPKFGLAIWKGEAELSIPNQTKLSSEEETEGRSLLVPFANRGREVAARWSALAATLRGTCASPSTPLSPERSTITLERRGTQIMIESVRDERPELAPEQRLYTKLTLLLSAGVDPFVLSVGELARDLDGLELQAVALEGELKSRYRVIAKEPAKFLQALTTPTTELLLRVTFGTIVCDGKTLCVYHLGLFDEAPRFEEWSELAFLLSAPTETPYR